MRFINYFFLLMMVLSLIIVYASFGPGCFYLLYITNNGLVYSYLGSYVETGLLGTIIGLVLHYFIGTRKNEK